MSAIKNAIASMNQSESKAAEIKEILNLLHIYGVKKAEDFENTIDKDLRTVGTLDNKTVPVSEIIASHQEIRVTTKDPSDSDMTNTIGSVLKEVLTGTKEGIIDGLTDLINIDLKVIMSAEEGEEREGHTYYIATEGLGIVRLDLRYWCRQVTAESITKYAVKSIVCTAVKSSVNVSKIDLNTFLTTYSVQLSRCQIPDDQLKEEIENARKIYELLAGKSDIKATPLSFQIQDCGVTNLVTRKVERIWPA